MEAHGNTPSITPPIFEALRRSPDGKWFKTVNLRTDAGMLIGLRMDVTEMKNQQTALAERLRENELYQNIIEAIPAAVYAKTPDLKLIYVNSGWEVFRRHTRRRCDRKDRLRDLRRTGPRIHGSRPQGS